MILLANLDTSDEHNIYTTLTVGAHVHIIYFFLSFLKGGSPPLLHLPEVSSIFSLLKGFWGESFSLAVQIVNCGLWYQAIQTKTDLDLTCWQKWIQILSRWLDHIWQNSLSTLLKVGKMFCFFYLFKKDTIYKDTKNPDVNTESKLLQKW